MEVYAQMKKHKLRLLDPAIVLGLLTAAFGISMLLQRLHPSESLVSLVFVLAVFLTSLLTQGYVWGVVASLSSVLINNFVFTFPYFAFDFISSKNLISALVMLAVAFITSTLTTKLKAQERMKAEAETEKMRGNLLRAISHDLRTPLTTILGSCSGLIDNYDTIPKEQHLRLLSEMREDSESLLRMVENLLSVTRVGSEAVAVRKSDTVLEELVDSVLLKFRKHYPEQTVLTSIPEDFISIPMDAMLIQQVLINLLENAVFHADGMTKLSLAVRQSGNIAVFEVVDNGCGIPRERLEHLFSGQLYGTATPTDSRRNGMGIGLSVCAAIIRAHGGTITAENLRSGGAVFRFTLEMEALHE